MERQLREKVVLDWNPPSPVVLAIYSEKGGVGKSSVAGGLAAVLAANGKSVLGIDLDPRGTFTAELGATTGEYSVNDVLYVDPAIDPDEEPELKGRALAALRPASAAWGDNVVVLAAERALSSREFDNSMIEPRLRIALEGVTDQVDCTIIDMPPRAGGKLVGTGLLAATHILYVGTLTTDGKIGIEDAVKTRKRVEQTSGTRLIEVGTLRNKVEGKKTQLATKYDMEFQEEFGNVLPFVVPDRVVRGESRALCVPITTSKSSAAADIINGYTRVLNATASAKVA